MKSTYRLKKNYQYNYVYKHAKSVSDKNFVLLYCASNVSQTKVGFSVSKKYGNAVRRNRIRRQLKSAVSQNVLSLKDGFNVIFIPRLTSDYLFADVLESVHFLLNKAGLTK